MTYLLAVGTSINYWFYYSSTTFSSSNLSVVDVLGSSNKLVFTALLIATDHFKGFELSNNIYI